MKIIPPKTDQDYRISYAQSWNLAVAMVSAEINQWAVKEQTPQMGWEYESLKKWQRYFYDKLVTETFEEKKDLTKATHSFESDLQAQREEDQQAGKLPEGE